MHTVAESEAHGLYEIRFTRLPNKGDFYNLAYEPQKINLEKLKLRYFTKFQALNMYYCEVNKHLYNVCPAFYRYKISPLVPEGRPGSQLLNRVFEVEEYMGRLFIEEVADMHQDHIRLLKNEAAASGITKGYKNYQQLMLESDQKSLPPYMWASKLAKMVSNLQKVKGTIKGAGRVIFEN